MFITTLGLPVTITWLVTLFAGLFLVKRNPALRKALVAILIAIPTVSIILGFLLQ